MTERTFRVGNHEYRIVAAPLTDGGYTTTVIHVRHAGERVAETRHDSHLRFLTEEDALDSGEMVAREMARRHAG